MAIKKLANKKYRLRLYLGKDPKTGEAIRHTSTHDKKSDALKEQERLLSLKGRITKDRHVYLDDVYKDWIENLETKNRKSNTLTSYKGLYVNHIAEYFSYVKLNDINTDFIEKFKLFLKREKKLSASLQKSVLLRTRDLFAFGFKKKHVLVDPFDEIDIDIKVPRKKQAIKFHEEREVSQLLNFLYNSKSESRTFYADFLMVAYSTGMRIGELCGLQVSCLDRRQNSLHLKFNLNKLDKDQANKYDAIFELDSLKGNAERVIYPAIHIIQIIKKYSKGKKPNELVFVPPGHRAKAKRIIVNKDENKALIFESKMINPDEFGNDIFIPMQKAAGLDHIISSHGTRYTFAANFVMNGGDLTALQEELGHVDPQTTKIYAQFSESKKRERNKYVDFSADISEHKEFSSEHKVSTNLSILKGGKRRD